MRTLFYLSVVTLFFMPFMTHAALNAGVVNGVWFSNTQPAAGERVRLFTAVQNQSPKTIRGTVAFLIDEQIVGSTPFTVTPRNIIAVSIPYTFIGTERNVSAYITSAQKNQVVYTTVSKTPITLATPPSIVKSSSVKPLITTATSTLGRALATTLSTSENVLTRISPLMETFAHRVETTRDGLITPSQKVTSSTTIKKDTPVRTTTTETSLPSVSQFTDATHILTSDTKRIFSESTPALWKKIVGVLLSGIAFFIRIWYLFFILFVLYLFWRIVRHHRIR